MFGSEDLAVLTKWFDCVRVPNDVVSPTLQKKVLKAKTGFLVFDGQGRLSARKGGVVPARALNSMLGKSFKATFKASPTRAVKNYAKWLKDLEKAEDAVATARATVRSLEERQSKKASASVKRQLEGAQQKLAEAQATLASTQSKGLDLIATDKAVAAR